jgi:hypothetical protein
MYPFAARAFSPALSALAPNPIFAASDPDAVPGRRRHCAQRLEILLREYRRGLQYRDFAGGDLGAPGTVRAKGRLSAGGYVRR